MKFSPQMSQNIRITPITSSSFRFNIFPKAQYAAFEFDDQFLFSSIQPLTPTMPIMRVQRVKP